MLTITDKTKCCGCGACFNACPKNCIVMASDNEGFLYPLVEKALCVNCGLCVKVCPVLRNKPQNKVSKVYAAVSKDAKTILKSSSGGMFSLLADYVLSRNGVAFGAMFDENFKVVHKFAQNKEELDALRRSKYTQSDIGDTFKQAKDFLNKGQYVLFAGTPCQIAGLQNYLNKKYENLYTVDIICHSVISPKVLEKYLKEYLTAKMDSGIPYYNLTGQAPSGMTGEMDCGSAAAMTDERNIKKIDFRDKTFGWDKSRAMVYLKGGKELALSNFMRGFGVSLYCRPSCGSCGFKGTAKYSDFTMADFWGVQKVKPEMYDKNGVSLLMLNSQKAMDVFEKIKQNMKYEELTIEEAVKYNPMFYKSVKPHPKREEFFKNFEKEPLDKLIKRLTHKPFIVKVFNFIRRKIGI